MCRGLCSLSTDFTNFLGFSSPYETVSLRSKTKPGTTIISAWRTTGADGAGPDGEEKHSNAYPPLTLIPPIRSQIKVTLGL